MSLEYEKYKNQGLTGLANVGNTCYINSCMQLLSHTYELNELLSTINKSKINNNVEAIILKERNNLRELMWSENCTIAPWGFIKSVHEVAKKKKRDMFSGYMQNDVAEFLLFVIDCLHCGLKREVEMTISGTVKNNIDILAQECYKRMQSMYKKEFSEILNIFYGISVTQIRDINTKEILSIASEPYSILTLTIPKIQSATIFDCFDLYNKEEDLINDNAWFNDKTNKKQNVTRNVIFWNLPNVLIINLNRYDYNNKKLHTLITTPLVNVNFSKYIHGYNKNEYIYDLFGTANHSGNVFGGHYTANIKNPNGKWYSFNDTSINEIPDDNVITQSTYCLFYRKKNNPFII